MGKILALAAILLLTACSPPKGAEPGADAKLDDGAVALMATAPDGTKLWATRSYGRTVYFSSSGTQHEVSCGKNCYRQEHVPAAGD